MNYEIRFIITVLHALAAIRCFSVKFILNLYKLLLAVSSINRTVKRVSIKRSQSHSLVSQQSHLNPQPMGTCTGVCKITLIRLRVCSPDPGKTIR